MTAGRVMALALWTFAYLVVALLFFGFTMMGDCSSGAAGLACEERRNGVSNAVLALEGVGYIASTWLIFFRRSRG